MDKQFPPADAILKEPIGLRLDAWAAILIQGWRVDRLQEGTAYERWEVYDGSGVWQASRPVVCAGYDVPWEQAGWWPPVSSNAALAYDLLISMRRRGWFFWCREKDNTPEWCFERTGRSKAQGVTAPWDSEAIVKAALLALLEENNVREALPAQPGT